jgi:hypothetical protein
MNLYFILEGEKTEVFLYPKWISYLRPDLKQVDFEKDVVENNYYIFSGGGIPSIYNHTVNAIKNINDNPVFNILVVCIDGEEIGVNARVAELQDYIHKSGIKLNDKCKIEYVVQNVCIESWFLGNRKIIRRTPENLKLREFIEHYNVVENDPELMDKMEGFRNKAHFHFSYFREILKEHKLTYSKARPKVVLEESFLNELKYRTEQTSHLPTLKNLFDFLTAI